jgi:hypothetical protein
MGRKSGPSVILLASSQSSKQRTGQVAGLEPREDRLFGLHRPDRFFERRIVKNKPSLEIVAASRSSPINSDRLNPPVKPIKSKARSRTPSNPSGKLAIIRFKSLVSTGVLALAAVPFVRRIPAITNRTLADLVGVLEPMNRSLHISLNGISTHHWRTLTGRLVSVQGNQIRKMRL